MPDDAPKPILPLPRGKSSHVPPRGEGEYEPRSAATGCVAVQPGWDLTQPSGEEWEPMADDPKKRT